MDLPDCPPGAEGYEDTVVEVPKKPAESEENCTKAEREFQEHLNSLKIKLEDGSTRCMVERRGRDISGKWIYLCYPCAAVCSGESILQTHISGKKHKIKLTMKTAWPQSIFDEHPFIQNTANKAPVTATTKVLQKMAEEVDLHNKRPSEWEVTFNRYRNVRCHIQEFLDAVKAPIVGAEYLVEHPPEQPHYEPSYICVLCNKQGHPRTIINHMTCFWHRSHFLMRHFPTACALLHPYRNQNKYREAVNLIVFRLAQRVEEKYGRMRPLHIDKEDYDADKERIQQWICKMNHFSEKDGATFEEIVDFGLIDSLNSENSNSSNNQTRPPGRREPSPPVVAAPKPHFNSFSRPPGRQARRAGSAASLSDVSDEESPRPRAGFRPNTNQRGKPANRFEPYQKKKGVPFRTRFALKNAPEYKDTPDSEKVRPRNYGYKLKLVTDERQHIEENLKKTLAYHEKNPEKHPLYPEEWKKFWNRRYKELQAEGKDPSKHDFKPEWIVFWTERMKQIYEEELRVQVAELYRRMRLSPPDDKPADTRRKSSERRRSPEPRRRSSPRRRSPEPRRRSPAPRNRSPESRRTETHRGGESRRSPAWRRSAEGAGRARSPPRRLRTRSRTRSRSPAPRRRSLARTHIELESSARRSRSPLSQRAAAPLPARNRSPAPPPARNRSPEPARERLAPSLQTVLISDDELRPDDLSPWNSDNDIDSIGSIPEVRSRTASVVSSRASRMRYNRDSRDGRPTEAQDLGPPENIVATLRLLVALEDYLGSIGPKIVDLLTEALKMEKEKANSSEELLVRENAVVLIETAKEKLKGAAQAGLVASAAAAAVRAAVVRAAATLHEADNRAKKRTQQTAILGATKAASMPVAGVGEVDRAEIAQQMAAALIAQGKTDVSSEELAQLVDAVVGMAEAKKREADRLKVAPVADKPKTKAAPLAKMSGTASALQLLQSAYDESDKKIDKEDAPDAMDGLSDSDLETLLKNFNELSAEEQHSLIAYLKKLEAKEPTRVERLRKYVSDAAASAPKREEKPPSTEPVRIESDDDDYTVEEVFQSATQKVKEDQIRQEMEIVKKSIEEHKPESPEPAKTAAPASDHTSNLSSATNLFALVQASLKSTPAPTAPANVVASTTQPRSFGDKSDTTNVVEPSKPIATLNPAPFVPQITPFDNQQNQVPPPEFNNQQIAPYNQGIDNYNQVKDNYNQGNDNYNQGNDNFNQGNANYNQGNANFNQGIDNYAQRPDYNQGNDHFVQQTVDYNQASDYNQPNNYNQPNDFNQGGNYYQGNDNYNQGNDNYNQGNDNFNQGNDYYNQRNDGFVPGNQGNNDFNQGQANYNQMPDNFNQAPWNQMQNAMDNRGPRGPPPKNFVQGGRGNFRGHNNNIRPQNANNNFRGRGKGNWGGQARGRGRGFY